MSNKVTYIEDLFDLDDVHPSNEQQSMQGHPPRVSQNFGRQMDNEIAERESVSKPLQGKIRQHYDHRMAANGGAVYEIQTPPYHPHHAPHGSQNPYQMQPRMPQYINPRHIQNAQNAQNVHNVHNVNNDYLLIEPNENYENYEDDSEETFEMGPRVRQIGNNAKGMMNRMSQDPQSFRCIDVARHIKNCPICIKFYDNDRSIYVIIIIILAIICIILLKKLLENMGKKE